MPDPMNYSAVDKLNSELAPECVRVYDVLYNFSFQVTLPLSECNWCGCASDSPFVHASTNAESVTPAR